MPDGETNAPGNAETIGWIAIESGAFTNNSVDIIATTTTNSITGWTDTPWYTFSFPYAHFAVAPGLIGNKQTRNGAEGGWLRYDSMSVDSVQLGIDERDDGERTHTSEVMGLFLLSKGGVLYDDGGSTGFVFGANTTKEFEFTIEHHDALPNQTYFFRLYDYATDDTVPLHGSSTAPSLSTEGATLTFSISGIAAGAATEGVTMDATTTATSVPFGSLPLGVDQKAAQTLTVTTNATEGYQIFMFERQDLTAGSGATIGDVTGTNSTPQTWATGCTGTATSCYGYHVGDNTLAGGSTRFLLHDTYAALTSSLAEVAYSSGPVTNESTDIVYRIQANVNQPAGQYESNVAFIVVPVF